MKMKVFCSADWVSGINKLMTTSAPIPMRTRHKLIEAKDFLIKESSRYEALRQELLNQYADKDEDGKKKVTNGVFSFSGENASVFPEKFNELCEIEIQPPVTIPFEDLERAESRSDTSLLTAAEQEALAGLIEAPQPTKQVVQ